MSSIRTFRVLARASKLYFIDIAGRNEQTACLRAEKLWHGGMRQRFSEVLEATPVTFEIDELASMHLADLGNEDRASWAGEALRAFAAKIGSEIDAEALHDLLADLGHYADAHDIEFLDVAARAIGCWALEQTSPDSTAAAPSVTITIGRRHEDGDTP